MLRVINPTKPLIEEVIETLMNIISLTHHNSVTLNSRVSNSSNGVDLYQW